MMQEATNKAISILGIRGLPAAHGGFETFSERLAPYLAQHGWKVTVYCQEDVKRKPWIDVWNDVRLVHIPVSRKGPLGSVLFDWKSTREATRNEGLILTLGYNTALFNVWYRVKNRANVINMDGIEWRRAKWSGPVKAWFYINERLGCWLGNHLIADHPEIKFHLATRVRDDKITMIPYGADRIEDADSTLLAPFGLKPNGYVVLIARAEPENSVLEIVSAFSRRRRGCQLVVLGDYTPKHNIYHRRVQEAASDEVRFVGAIYQKPLVEALRFFSRLYVHGHQVGGTNPSLVEALGAGSAVLAHDNPFNRWVAGREAEYFLDDMHCDAILDRLLDDQTALENMRRASAQRYKEAFVWEKILREYDVLLTGWWERAVCTAQASVRP